MRALVRRLTLLLQTIRWPALALLLVIPAEALARAGGGEGFHGSSHGGGGGGGFHGGGGGGGGGGSDNGLILWLIIQLISHPAIGIPVLIIAAILVWAYLRDQQRQWQPGATPPPDGDDIGPAIPNAAAWISDLRRNDPAFDENVFYSRVRIAFDKIQQAWCAQDLTGVRPFISDAVYERFLLQIAEQRDKGYRDFMEGLQVLDLRMAEIESDGIYDEIGVRIRAVSVDYHISLTTGQRLSGAAYPEEFVEIWTFVRRQGAKTRGGPGLIEGNCPNCGAAIEMNQSAECAHCKALLRSGEYDWVLTEITQESEWSGVRRKDIPGLEELRRRDPDFNAAGIEDRASVAFWRFATAERLGKVDPLRKVASPAFLKTFEPHLHPQPGQPRLFRGDDAVGSVQLLGILPGGEYHRALVEVTWNGTQYAAGPEGPPRPVGGEALFHTILVFFRRADAKTEVGKGISSAHCPNCGAPESGGASNACDFCGTVLTDGAHGWVLDAFLSRADPQAQGILQELHHPAPVGVSS
jgi:hypothetical protein